MDPKVTAAGVAFMGPGDEFLFLRRSAEAGDHQGEWSWPGGGIESGESPEQAAAREVNEELGYLIEPETLGKITSHYQGFNTYTFPVEELFIPGMLGNEHDDYVWARLDEAPQPLHPGVIEMLYFNLQAASGDGDGEGTGNPDLTQGELPREQMVGDQSYTVDTFTADGNYFAPIAIGKKRRLTPDGQLIIEDCGLARTGTMLYTKKDLPNLEADSQGLIAVERTPEEVFHPDTIASFEAKAVTLYHPSEFVKPHNWKLYSVGHVQNVRRGEGLDSDLLKGDIIIQDAAAIHHANLKLPHISCGYDAQYKQLAPGRASQHTIRGNHAAMVDKGRAGSRCAITDEDTTTQTGVDAMKKSFWAVTTAYLRGKGVNAQDITQLQALTKDSAGTDDDAPIEPIVVQQPTNDAAPPAWASQLVTGFNDMATKVSAVAAWQKAFDETCEKEKEMKDQAAKDQAAKDSEAAAQRKKDDDCEKTGDVLIQAEEGPNVYSLGKIWNGLTGDAAITEVNSLTAVLAPDMPKVAREAVAGTRGVAIANHMREALTRRATTDSESVAPFIMDGTPIAQLTGTKLAGAFRAAGNLAKIRNNALLRTVAAPKLATKDGDTVKRPVDPVTSYKATMEKYSEDKAKPSSNAA